MKTNLMHQVLSFCCFLLACFSTGADAADGEVENVVLVHGSFADGSGWHAVAEKLVKDGYRVAVVQEPETSFAADVAAVKRVIEQMPGPVVLVGHSYGGAVITQAGNDDKVRSLVYVAAFEPDDGEAVGALSQKIPALAQSVAPTSDGYLFLKPESFAADFAADVPKEVAEFMAHSQVYTAAEAFGAPISSPAWKTKPSWAVVATQDRMISPELERFMTKRAGSKTIEIAASHAVYLSHPSEIAKIIEAAASAGSH